jgi:hypothetical protein
MLEKRLAAVSPQSFIISGGADGSITVSDTSLFKVKQEVILSASSTPNLDQIEVKRIVSPNVMYVGPKGGNIDSRIDVSAYTVALNAAIFANEQKRPSIPFEEFTRAVYEEEPVVAQRSVLVDKNGNKYDNSNPFPVDASVSIGDITIGTDGYNTNAPDSMNITGSENGAKVGTKYGFVYNRRQQVLAAHDRVETYTYADFGTKNQRIVRVDYTSSTFPGITVRRDFNYVLDGSRYRRTNSPWIVI